MRYLLFLMMLPMFACSSLNHAQRREYKEWKSAGIAQEVKSEGLAAGLNILPGFGDFYNGNVGLGVLNLLFWPVSVLWAPVGGATGAEEANYYETKTVVSLYEKNKTESISLLMHAFSLQQLSKEQYILLTQKFQRMDLKEFQKVRYYQDFLPLLEISVREPASRKVK